MPETQSPHDAFPFDLGDYPTAAPQTDEEKDLVAFAYSNAGRYLARLRSMRQGSLTFNVAALLVAPLWLAYRKLYEWLAL